MSIFYRIQYSILYYTAYKLQFDIPVCTRTTLGINLTKRKNQNGKKTENPHRAIVPSALSVGVRNLFLTIRCIVYVVFFSPTLFARKLQNVSLIDVTRTLCNNYHEKVVKIYSDFFLFFLYQTNQQIR